MMRGPAATGIAVNVQEEDVMNRRTFASIAAVFGLANAVPGLIAPATVASLYGLTLDSQSALVAQMLAASYIGYALINWTTRECTEIAVRRGIDAANLVGWGATAVIWIYAASSGLTNAATTWVGAAFTLLFAVGWAYFVITDRAIASRVVTAAPR
jgi:hypothetical protein